MTTHHEGKRLHKTCKKRNLNSCDECIKNPIRSSSRLKDDCLSNFCSSTKTKEKSRKTAKDHLMWSCNAIKPLASFYDSIPDYCDIHELSKNEFESTICSLKATCQSLKSKALSPTFEPTNLEDTSTSSFCSLKPKKGKKCKLSCKKKSKKTCSLKKQLTNKFILEEPCLGPCNIRCQNDTYDKRQLKSFRDDCEKEVENYRQSLKEFESELKHPLASPCLLTRRPKSPLKVDESSQTCNDDEFIKKPTCTTAKDKYLHVPNKNKFKFESFLSESLKKSLSLNDIQANPEEEFAENERKKLLDKLKTSDDKDEVIITGPQN